MRIISGQLKGHRFQPPARIPARPTTDIAKEGLFNILMNQMDFEETRFLDLFGGTGSISFEIGSRGCKDITLVEKDHKSVAFIRKQAAEFNLEMQVLQMDVFEYMKTCNRQFDLIFAGPPYPLPNLSSIPEVLFAANILEKHGWLVLEHNPSHQFDEHPNFRSKRNYGTTIFSIFEQP